MNDQNTVREEVLDAVKQTVRRELEPFGFRAVTVTAAEDHDGDPILLIEVDYGRKGHPVDPNVLAGLVTKLRNRLWDMGETRFPHIRHRYPESRKIVGYP